MPDLKKIRVREAKPRDIGLFKKLWREFLIEQQQMGSVVVGDSDRNLEIFTNIFRMYVDPDVPEDAKYDGIVLFISEVAVMMAGDPGTNIEMSIAHKPANVWGLYVVPDQRGKALGLKLYQDGFKRLKEMGFDLVMGEVVDGNTYSIATLDKAAGHALRIPTSPYYAKLTE